jgi:hypothetical protein
VDSAVWLGLASSAVAVAAVASTLWTTRRTLEQQRTLAAEQRLWDKQADLYWRFVTLCVFDRFEYEADRYRRDVLSMSGELAVFGSRPMLELYEAVRESLDQGIFSSQHDEAIAAVRDQCRAELGTDRRQAPKAEA